MKYRIRQMTARDYDAVVSLWRGIPGIGLDDDSDSRLGITRYLKRNPGLSFVAQIQGMIVGAGISITLPLPHHTANWASARR